MLLTVVFLIIEDYNCQIMSSEEKNERNFSKEIDSIFDAAYGTSIRGRIQLAAHAIAFSVVSLDALKDKRDQTFGAVEAAPPINPYLRSLGFSNGFYAFVPPVSDEPSLKKDDINEVLNLFDEHDELRGMNADVFSPVEKAKLALEAATDGIRAVHNLSKRQANKAIKLSRKSTNS